MDSSVIKSGLVLSAVLLCTVVTGCGGTKVLDEATPYQAASPLAEGSNPGVIAALDWVIVRDGPGTWARGAEWDEYLFRVQNQGALPIQVTGLVVIDSLGARLTPDSDRQELVWASQRVVKRYKKAGIGVSYGKGVFLKDSDKLALAGYGVAGAMVAAGTAAGALGGLALFGLIAPVYLVVDISSIIDAKEVGRIIEQRQQKLPMEISPGEESALIAIFPIAPSPEKAELIYLEDGVEKRIDIDTHIALQGLHLTEEFVTVEE